MYAEIVGHRSLANHIKESVSAQCWVREIEGADVAAAEARDDQLTWVESLARMGMSSQFNTQQLRHDHRNNGGHCASCTYGGSRTVRFPCSPYLLAVETEQHRARTAR